MAQKLTLPDANSTFGKCPHCGAEVKIDSVWYAALQKLLQALNGLLT